MTHEMDSNEEQIGRRLALFADKVLQGLDDLESAEIRELPPSEMAELLAMERAAAVAASLDLTDSPALPNWLAAKIETDAARHSSTGVPETLKVSTRRDRITRQLGWWVAAASIAFALINLPRPAPPVKVPATSIEATLEGSPAAGLVNTGHPLGLGANGRVVWNSARQEGYLALKGLAPIDRRKGIYQLWIFDGDRDERYPVDGGIFAIEKAGATTIVPIRPGIEVKKPTLFAVTLEPPGGVVVSDRQRLLLTASWNASSASRSSSTDGKP